MNKTISLLDWPDVNPDRWSYKRFQAHFAHIVFALSRLPNFAEPRFVELGDKLDARKAEVVRRQMQMLRQLHSLNDCVLALRFRRDGNRLRLFVVARVASDQTLTKNALDRLAIRIQQMFPHEYSLLRLSPEKDSEGWKLATDLSWARFADELFKPEDTYRANTIPFFYSASLWESQAVNDMELVCHTLLRFSAEVMLDITFAPTILYSAERDWIDTHIRRIREAQSGERITSKDGKTQKTFDPMPGLRAPLENYENLIKRYDHNRLFLSSFRIFASDDPSPITQVLAASATRSHPGIIHLDHRHKFFPLAVQTGQTVDIAPEIHSAFWDDDPDTRPFRAQRLHRLVDIDELASFWRFPIPIQAGFPGFEIDTGLGSSEIKGKRCPPKQMDLGILTDDPTQAPILAAFDREQLTMHGLIVGMPGSGKTTAMFNILYQLWSQHDEQERVPFIVLEPAKTEYRALKGLNLFKDDMLVFTLGDERISPFRFNPFEVLEGVSLESHISRLNACFMGAFNLFDPLPLLLDKAIRETYAVKGWFDDSVGGEPGLHPPTLADLCKQAERVIKISGYSDKLRDDFNAALLQRLESLRRGSKGRMLDTKESVFFDRLMQGPIILELDTLNDDEKALLMMFILTFVYEYAKSRHKSGSSLKHVLVVEEAHNLIGRGNQGGSEIRANPKEQAVRLFVRMLAEMRALGQGILIADQLPTAIAPEAMKQTNLKILMRMTAQDDRLEIGNTMDLNEAQLKDVVHFKSGQAYVFLEGWERVRRVQTTDFKHQHNLEEPPGNDILAKQMDSFEAAQPHLFMPFPECTEGCKQCNRRTRSQAEQFIRPLVGANTGKQHIYFSVKDNDPHWGTVCRVARLKILAEAARLQKTYGVVNILFPFCAYVHLLNLGADTIQDCHKLVKACQCKIGGHNEMLKIMLQEGEKFSQPEEAK